MSTSRTALSAAVDHFLDTLPRTTVLDRINDTLGFTFWHARVTTKLVRTGLARCASPATSSPATCWNVPPGCGLIRRTEVRLVHDSGHLRTTSSCEVRAWTVTLFSCCPDTDLSADLVCHAAQSAALRKARADSASQRARASCASARATWA